VTMPRADQPVSFAEHIKPLFRPSDRESMTFAFDLWDVDDVRSNADAILGRLRQARCRATVAGPPTRSSSSVDGS
jgi:hypothetical protein